LGREHIVPFGLGGELILPKASCRSCETITGRVEQMCLRGMFGPLRHAAGLQTRRPKERPSEFPLKLVSENGEVRIVMVPADEYPTTVHLIELPPARILRGLPDEGATPVMAIPWVWMDRRKLFALMNKLGQRDFNTRTGLLDPLSFTRMLSKIAHAYAVAELGVDSFQHLATGFILSGSAGINLLVGAQAILEPLEGSTASPYHLSIATHTGGMIVVGIRLFGDLQAPVYHVVVGLKAGGQIVPTFQDWRPGQPAKFPFVSK
jgi:hypothetical protein